MLTKELTIDRAILDDKGNGLKIIRLRLEGMRMEGIARSFSSADKILSDWCGRFQGNLCCEYEISYVDGNTVLGHYAFRSKTGGRPCLERFLHKGTSVASASSAAGARSAEARGSDGPGDGNCTMTRTHIRLPAYRACVSEKE